MRIVEKEEVFMTKCYYCGAKNKLAMSFGTEKNRHRPEGFVIRCCNCGRLDYFSRDWKNPLDMLDFTKKFKRLDVQCIEQHACPHTDCPYYGLKNKPESKPPADCGCDCCEDTSCNCISLAPPPKFK